MPPPVASLARSFATPEAAWRVWAALRRLAGRLEAHYRLVLGAFVVLQWCGLLALALAARHNGWLYYHGGDGTWYWSDAWALGHFRLPYGAIGYGIPYLWAPAGAVLGPSLLSGLPFVILLDGLVLVPLALLLFYGVAERIAGRLFGLVAAAAWLVVPLLAYRMFRADYRPRLLDNFLPGAWGLNTLGDFTSMVACLAAALFALRALDNRARTDTLLAGLLAGFAVGIKPANALFLPAPALALLVARRYRHLLVYGLGVVPALVALAVWKQRGLGELPILGSYGVAHLAAGQLPVAGLPGPFSRYHGLDWHQIEVQMKELREIFWSKTLLEWGAFAGTFALLRRDLAKGLLVASWFWAFLLVKGGSSIASVYATTFFRLLVPAYPAFLLLAVASAALLFPRGGRAPEPPPSPRPVGRRSAAAAAVLLGILPLLLVGVARPAKAGSFAHGLSSGVEAPVVPLGVRVRVTDGAVRLSWPAHTSRRATLTYRVFRGSSPGEDCALLSGVPDCYVYSPSVGNLTTTTFVDRPQAGTWVYRVAVTGSWDRSPADADVLLLSPPVTVTVR